MVKPMKTERRLWKLLSFGAGLLLARGQAWSSINRGSIRGTITDPQGAAVPRAVISVTNADTGVQQTTQTNGAGFYLVPELVPGTYRVHLESGGFVSAEVNGVAVKADDVATVDMQLRLGRMAQHVEVTATNPLGETTAANFSIPRE